MNKTTIDSLTILLDNFLQRLGQNPVIKKSGPRQYVGEDHSF